MGVEPFDADAASDCDSGGHPWQLDGDTGSDSCSDDQGRSSIGYSDSDGRLWRLESSRSPQTPPPIVTSAATPGRSTETPPATPAPTIKVGPAAAIPTPADQQRLFRLRRTPVEARVEPFDADAASD
ncbi:hypothetical protein PF008_g25911 [Phytophthora fragariae]|uniref:Uncharacterized protein n=1 Tax=Phytophthora fragariae TaxID=53985 RepID=A0A6G0QJB2_9STRA|nr:hypothetical protein PF008_g25911 [Phytophthora fragariae]